MFSYLKDQKCHFYFLQVIYSELKDELICNKWGGNGTNRQKGFCILLNSSRYNLVIESQYSGYHWLFLNKRKPQANHLYSVGFAMEPNL